MQQSEGGSGKQQILGILGRVGLGGNFTGSIHRHLFTTGWSAARRPAVSNQRREKPLVIYLHYYAYVLKFAAGEKWVVKLIREGRREELNTDDSGQRFRKVHKETLSQR